MDKLLAAALLINLINLGWATLKIKEVRGPDSVQNGFMDEIVLDCDFEAVGETGVVLKWFYNGQIEQIYQWIPEYPHPGIATGRLKNNIDTEYRATNDNKTMYRALKLKEVSPSLSGNYTCKVSSDEDEVSETKQLIIYTPAESDLNLTIIYDSSVAICTVNGVSPKPNIDLYISGNQTLELDLKEYINEENGLYNITIISNFNNTDLSSPATFVCDLNIPGTSYFLSTKMDYYQASSGVISGLKKSVAVWSCIFVFLLIK